MPFSLLWMIQFWMVMFSAQYRATPAAPQLYQTTSPLALINQLSRRASLSSRLEMVIQLTFSFQPLGATVKMPCWPTWLLQYMACGFSMAPAAVRTGSWPFGPAMPTIMIGAHGVPLLFRAILSW